MKEASHKRAYTVWFHLYEVSSQIQRQSRMVLFRTSQDTPPGSHHGLTTLKKQAHGLGAGPSLRYSCKCGGISTASVYCRRTPVGRAVALWTLRRITSDPTRKLISKRKDLEPQLRDSLPVNPRMLTFQGKNPASVTPILFTQNSRDSGRSLMAMSKGITVSALVGGLKSKENSTYSGMSLLLRKKS